jgi:hypothetical protein
MTEPHEPYPPSVESYPDTQRCIWREVGLAEDVLNTEPQDTEVLPLSDWGEDSDMATAFQRGRTIMQALAFGHRYWASENRLSLHMDDTVFADQSDLARTGTARLLQLVALSRNN